MLKRETRAQRQARERQEMLAHERPETVAALQVVADRLKVTLATHEDISPELAAEFATPDHVYMWWTGIGEKEIAGFEYVASHALLTDALLAAGAIPLTLAEREELATQEEQAEDK